MQTPATPADLSARGLTDIPGDVADTWLGVVWRALQRELPGLTAAVNAGAVSFDDVVDVVCAGAMRVLRNPEGRKQESGQVDDYSESWTNADSTQDVFFTAAELRRIAPATPSAAGSFRYA